MAAVAGGELYTAALGLAILGARQTCARSRSPLKSSAEPRNEQVRANRGNENGNKQPVHFEISPQAQAFHRRRRARTSKISYLQSR